MNKRTSSILIMIVLAIIAVQIVPMYIPEFQGQLNAFFTYFAFIGLVVLLLAGRKR